MEGRCNEVRESEDRVARAAGIRDAPCLRL